MTIVYQAQDSDEFWHDTDAEQVANQHLYGVLSGCEVTYDASDMTVDVAVGTVIHNGTVVTVAAQADAVTLVADSSNERWAYVAIDSGGSAALVSGDAAADSSTEPTKPELGDRVILAAVKIEAGQTVADNISVKLDKRLMLTRAVIRKAADETVNNSDTLQDDDDFVVNLGASEKWHASIRGRATIGATPDIQVAFTVPSGTTVTGYGKKINAADHFAAASTDLTSALSLADANAGIALELEADIEISTTAGEVQFQWAQDTATMEDTKLHEGMVMVLERCA